MEEEHREVIPRRRGINLATISIALTLACGCSRFDPSAPYHTLESGLAEERLPVPADTRVIEHVPVSIGSRTGRIELVDDVVLTAGAEPFYRPGDVDSDGSGTIFVHDGGNQNIVVFDAQGEYLRTMARAGQGPGELGIGGDFAAAEAAVAHVARNRINVWADNRLLASRNVVFTTRLSDIRGAGPGRFVAFARARGQAGFRRDVVAIDLDGYRIVTYANLPREGNLMVIQGDRGTSTRLPRPRPAFAASRAGDVYVTAGAFYEVVAFAADGAPRWVLQVDWPRQPVTDEHIERALAYVMGLDEEDDIPSGFSNVRRSDVEWPEFMPALVGTFTRAGASITVDGHGHLYVFPFIPADWDHADQPVDVYSSEGEHLFSGMMPITSWSSARGDYVYGVRTDPYTEERVAVRYRLIEPF